MINIKKIDMHTHTTGSDGTHSPAEMLRLCKAAGLDTVAISDHDTIINIAEGINLGRKLQINVIPAVELSASFNGELHILGYGIDIYNKELLDLLAAIRHNRDKRNPKIVKKLIELGYKITMEDILAISDTHVSGRVHIAQAMVEKGYFPTIQSVFDKLIVIGKPAYVKRILPTSFECIGAISNAGGYAVIAHPKLTELSYPLLYGLIKDLKSKGLYGIEAYHSAHNKADIKSYIKIAEELDMTITCGSDSHGIEGGPKVGYNCPEKMPQRTVNWLVSILKKR